MKLPSRPWRRYYLLSSSPAKTKMNILDSSSSLLERCISLQIDGILPVHFISSGKLRVSQIVGVDRENHVQRSFQESPRPMVGISDARMTISLGVAFACIQFLPYPFLDACSLKPHDGSTVQMIRVVDH